MTPMMVMMLATTGYTFPETPEHVFLDHNS